MILKKNEIAKMAAAKFAVKFVKPGMTIGLGTGSTSSYFIKELGKLVANGLKIKAVATSYASDQLATSLGIKMIDVNSVNTLDLCVDGADEIDQKKQMIKGGGGALFREKIIACMSQEMIVLVDESKVVETLGKFPIPIEITPFAYKVTSHKLLKFAKSLNLRKTDNGSPFITDNHNFIVDLQLKNSDINFENINHEIKEIPGVCETGLFLAIAGKVIIGYEDGHVEMRE